ncbi:hypothetical protein [Planctomycetes bacterium K23_9]|uniref:DUF4476 domain-containing protein n=1 Tax=Stieleria marina TaxID=1930275 RepID=A0A517NWJ6_9BACT|nr:hypothetical protein K239x_34640 [Planctomycetes bacterium K23_9]
MRPLIIVVCVLTTSSLAYYTTAYRSNSNAGFGASQNPMFSTNTDVVATRDPSLLAEFKATLNRDIILKCVAQHEAGREMDLDYLATCGDFDVYARYLRISKFEAVKKFQHVIIYSSSMLEFEERLAR